MLHSMPRLLGRTFVAVAATHIYSTNGIDTAYSDTIPSTAAAAAVTASTPKTSVTLSQSTNQSKYIYNAEERKRMFENIVILSGSSNPILSSRIVDHLGTSITHMDVHRFSDGEVSCVINESIRGKDVFLIQTCGAPVNDNIMELLLTVTAARRSGANRIVAVVPYFGYKYHKRGLPISSLSHSRFLWSASNDLAKMLQAVGVDAVLSVDLERPGQGHEACFFDCSIPVETLTSVNMFVNYFKNNVTLNNKVIVVSPNTECVKRAKKFQKKLKQVTGKDILYGAFISHSTVEMGKKRMKDNEVIFGDVAGADVIIIDDIVETGATLNTLCRALKKKGAEKVYLCAPHGLFTPDAIQLINVSPVESVIVTDSVALPHTYDSRNGKIVQVSVAKELATIIEKEVFHEEEIVSRQLVSYDDPDDDDIEID